MDPTPGLRRRGWAAAPWFYVNFAPRNTGFAAGTCFCGKRENQYVWSIACAIAGGECAAMPPIRGIGLVRPCRGESSIISSRWFIL
ncbi:hypothetical protein [Tardiphaga sp.]|jgi:hypothetical protein|uniref:hypothetical protein n=1 Tax=Tardiphaga sp. TaxID=1926292 RepID=UPI00262EFF61|nr:hypothetical protein [Tardiphaga sp.]